MEGRLGKSTPIRQIGLIECIMLRWLTKETNVFESLMEYRGLLGAAAAAVVVVGKDASRRGAAHLPPHPPTPPWHLHPPSS